MEDRPLDSIVVLSEEMIKLLKGLNPPKADELHPRILKELANELGLVFVHLFQQSLDTSEIPNEWRLANICLFFKKGYRTLACNYRSVSLTCVSCKLFRNNLFVLRFYDPVKPMGSCRARSVYLTTRLLGRLSPLND